MKKSPYRKNVDDRPASKEVALSKFCEQTGIELTVEQIKDPGSCLRLVGGEERLVLSHLRDYYKEEAEQDMLRKEYAFSSKFEQNLPKVLEIVGEIPAYVAAEELFHFPIEDLQPTMQIRPENAATDFCALFCQVFERVGHFLQIRRKGIAEKLIDPGPTVDYALRRLIARLLTIRKNAAREAVNEDILFKKTPVFGLDEVPPFHQDHWYELEMDVCNVLEEVWRQHKASNTLYQAFLTYQQVALLLRAASIERSKADENITEFGRRVKGKVRRQWTAFLKTQFPGSEGG